MGERSSQGFSVATMSSSSSELSSSSPVAVAGWLPAGGSGLDAIAAFELEAALVLGVDSGLEFKIQFGLELELGSGFVEFDSELLVVLGQ